MTISEKCILDDIENCSLEFILTVIRDNCKDGHTVEFINKMLELKVKNAQKKINKNKKSDDGSAMKCELIEGTIISVMGN